MVETLTSDTLWDLLVDLVKNGLKLVWIVVKRVVSWLFRGLKHRLSVFLRGE